MLLCGSISLMIYLSSRKLNIIPVIKTTKKEIDAKILESRPSKVIYLNSKGKISVHNPVLSKEKTKITVPKNNTGLVLFSSGTTGKPKVMVQNRALVQIGVLIVMEMGEYEATKAFLLFNKLVHNALGVVKK